MINRLKKIAICSALLLTGCNSLDNMSSVDIFSTKKTVNNQSAVLAKDMYLCETYLSEDATTENYLTYPGNYFRHSKTLLPSPDVYAANRAQWQNWHVFPASKSRIIAFLPHGTLLQIDDYKKPNKYDELFGDKTQDKMTIMSGAYKGKTVIVTTTFLRPA